MSWATNFFDKQSTSVDKNYSAKFKNLTKENYNTDFNGDWSYLQPNKGLLGDLEIRSNNNLLNPDEFAKYWQSGKHANHKIYKGYDWDGDKEPDLVAVDPTGQVVGFNERYIVAAGQGETPYKRSYYNQPKSERQKISYQQYLESQESKDGWKDLTKFKESRSKATHKVIGVYLLDQLNEQGATLKEIENISKQLVNIIASVFFATDVPAYQIRAIKGSPEFKKIMSSQINSTTISTYLPEAQKANIARGMISSVRGYSDGGLINALKGHLNSLGGDRITKQNAETLYVKILTKQAANIAYKKHKISPMFLVEHPEAAAAFKAEVEKEMAELDKKHKTDAINFN